MKIWFEKHQRYFVELDDFEDDDIEEFAGHDLLEQPEEADSEDMSWLFPPKGPGKFKDLDKKKKKKKGKGGKKKKGKKQKKWKVVDYLN